MNFHWPRFEDPAAMQDLRVRLLAAEIRAALLESMTEAALRKAGAYRLREPRRDKAEIMRARASMTERLRSELGR